MRRIFSSTALAAAVTVVALASCAGCSAPRVIPEAAPPIPVPSPVAAPTPSEPAPPTYSGDWRDWPMTPGDWVYRQDARGGIALYGQPGQDAVFTVRCDRARGEIYLSRLGNAAQTGGAVTTIRTSSTLQQLTMRPVGGGQPYVAAALGPRDTIVDAMGFSRGRFIVEGGGLPTLVIPAWAEVLRVAEDCRG
jgi:hypothetical protein